MNLTKSFILTFCTLISPYFHLVECMKKEFPCVYDATNSVLNSVKDTLAVT